MYFTHENFAKVLNIYNYRLHIGDIVAGTIFNKEKDGYLIDIGANNAAYLPLEEVSLNGKSQDILQVNDILELFILAYNEESRQLILSLRRLAYIKAWARIKQLKTEDIIIQVPACGINKGGILIEIEDIQGFIPNSHLSYLVQLNNLSSNFILCKLLVAEEQSNKLILSNRCAILEKMIQNLHIGKTYDSTIIKIKTYGIIVNIYNIPALLHVSEIGISYITDLNELFTVGDNLKVQIIHIDIKQGRLSVSRRKIQSK
uniref:Ribosomal protein S1 n=1 Tax=Balbiania investiens TaxID=111861 RepID=A0A4D6BNL4_9FLOR|nr:ribosomal protein S1 [Balbiania investiens]QBX88569.1 ribosomal protein S1 [Balbiania investiens]